MKIGKRGISFIEVIVSVAILIIISVVAVTTHTSMVDKTNNSKIVSDMTSLENSLTSYKSDKSEIPTPNGNLKYFKEDTSYAHDITDAFAVSGFVTEKTIPKKYINYLPLDPKTGQYYALSTTKDESSFEIAGVVKNNESYKSKVSGNWSGESGPYNLIREYNGPNFVYDDAIENFPYNPEELLLTAKISDYSGSLLINSKTYTKDEVLSLDLREGDKIEVGTGSSAEMYLSDGSYSTLGDISTQTQIVLANMRYVEENNLFTNVKIALNMGSIWTKASSLGEKSDYEIYTTDTVASVRGTIFGVNANATKSNVVVLEGEVEIEEITSIPEGNTGNDFDNLTKAIQDNKIEEIQSENVGEIPGVTNGSGVIVVEKGEDPKAIEVNNDETAGTMGGTRETSGSGIIEKIPEEGKEKIENNLGEINNSIRLKILELSNTGEVVNRYVKIALTDTLRKGNIVKINDKFLTGSYLPTSNTGLTLTGYVLSGSDIVNISICKNKKCTRELKVDFSQKVAYKKDSGTGTLTSITEFCSNSFIIDGKCVENYLDGFKLVGFTNYENNVNMTKSGGTLPHGAGSLEDTGVYYKYNSSSGVFMSGDYDYILNPRKTSSLSDANLPTFFSKISSHHTIYKWGGYGTGLFIENDNISSSDKDNIRYDVSSLNLNSGSGFAIEMGVRGGALKRTFGEYLLATTLPNNTLLLGLEDGEIYFGENYSNSTKININSIRSSFNTDEFYKITGVYNDNKLSLKISKDGINEIKSSVTNISATAFPKINKYLYIGSSNNASNQWNDIIDYVKIYQK